MRYLYIILCVFVLAALLAGCKVQGETKEVQNDSNNEDELQEPSVIIPDSPVDGAANTSFENICASIEQLPDISTQAPNEVYETCEKTSQMLFDYFNRNNGYGGTDSFIASYPNGYYLKLHPLTTEYSDNFRIIVFGNTRKEMGSSEYIFIQSFRGNWVDGDWIPNISCQQIASFVTNTLSSEELLSASFHGSRYLVDLILVSSKQDWGDFPFLRTIVNLFHIETGRATPLTWEPIIHNPPKADAENWHFTNHENGYGYYVHCGLHNEETSFRPFSYKEALSGRGFKLTCPYDNNHNITILPTTDESHVVSINNVDVPLILLPAELGKYYSYGEHGGDLVEDPNGPIFDIGNEGGCGWWCPASRDVIITSNQNNPYIDHSVFDFKRDTYWLSNGNGFGEWINFRTIYSDSDIWGAELWSLPQEPGPEYGIHTIGFVNGNATNIDYWTEYSRAKTVDVLVDGALLYRLQLIDTIEYQLFSLPFPIIFKYYIPFDIRFEIIDVYPGKNATVAISDITLEPLIYH